MVDVLLGNKIAIGDWIDVLWDGFYEQMTYKEQNALKPGQWRLAKVNNKPEPFKVRVSYITEIPCQETIDLRFNYHGVQHPPFGVLGASKQ
jgi:hypothetical protein